MSNRHGIASWITRISVPQRVGVLLLFFLIAAEMTAVLVINHNRFFYTLDDPYIHLALAKNISAGHYGINAGEYSAPSSSIIWPFLLAPFAAASVFTLIPLIFNVVAACGSVFLFGTISEALIGTEVKNRSFIQSMLVVVLCICTNVTGLIFTGMEHSLQLLITLLIVNGLLSEIRTGRVHWALILCIAGAPLVRYECVAVSCAAALFLFLRGHRIAALVPIAIMIAALAAFSGFLMSMGLSPFPSSVMAKSAVMAGKNGHVLVAGVLSTVIAAFASSRGLLLAAVAASLGGSCFLKKIAPADRLLAACMAGAVILHLFFGRYGSYNRYEVYIWSAGLISLLYVYRGQINFVIFAPAASGPFLRPAISAALLLFVSYPYVIALVTLPAASGNIYRQHFQMRRFAVRYYKKPVGVNDIGLVSYRNPFYVLDYAGLASEKALRHLRSEGGGAWMDMLAREHDVRLAMIYREWFNPVPPGWIPVGELRLDGPLITPAGRSVTFFAMDSLTFRNVQPLIDDFAASLPDGARFEWSDGREEERFGIKTSRHNSRVSDKCFFVTEWF